MTWFGYLIDLVWISFFLSLTPEYALSPAKPRGSHASANIRPGGAGVFIAPTVHEAGKKEETKEKSKRQRKRDGEKETVKKRQRTSIEKET